MKLEMFINFNGNCQQALDFYAKVFRSEVQGRMLFSDAPQSPEYTTPEADMNKVMYAGIPVGQMILMFSDTPSGHQFIEGNNIIPTLNIEDKDEVTRIFNELADGGQIYMPLGQTFFSEYYGMLKDRFGIIWNILQYAPGA